MNITMVKGKRNAEHSQIGEGECVSRALQLRHRDDGGGGGEEQHADNQTNQNRSRHRLPRSRCWPRL